MNALRPCRFATSLCATLLLALASAAPPAGAQQPPADTSVEALVQALRSGPTSRAFRRTELPEAGSNLCGGQDGGGRSGPAAGPAADPAANPSAGGAAGPAAAGTRSLSTTRNLEVVPYAGDTTPGLNLSVQFATASDKLTASDRALLDRLAAALQKPELAQDRFAVAGHTDISGDARINLELSCARALAVRRYLASKGVAEQRLSSYGFGSTRLLAQTEAGNGQQRRVEVRKAPQ